MKTSKAQHAANLASRLLNQPSLPEGLASKLADLLGTPDLGDDVATLSALATTIAQREQESSNK